MVDIDLLLKALEEQGHTIGHWRKLPENAGGYEMQVDGTLMTLDEARALLEADQARTTAS
jgi:hypothetical protein